MALNTEKKNENQLDSEVRDLMAKVNDLEARKAAMEDRVDRLRADEHKLSDQSTHYKTIKTDLDKEEEALVAQIEAMNRHSDTLKNQNEELGGELEEMVHTDEIIRERLDRRRRVEEIRARNNASIGASRAHIEKSKSPTRARN